LAIIRSANTAHASTVLLAEAQRQISVAASGNNQGAVGTAEITFYRTCLASAKANNCGYSQFVVALQQLGTGGS
jgi:hypothetical protein